eukprot:gene13758-16261_t
MNFAHTGVTVAAAVFAHCILRSSLTMVNKLVIQYFAYPNLVLVLQNAACVTLLLLGQRVTPHLTGQLHELQPKIVKPWLVLTVVYLCAIASSMYAMEVVTSQTLILARTTATLFTAVADFNFLHTELGLREGISLVLIFAGAYHYSCRDLNYDFGAYCWLAVHVICTSAYQIYVKWLVKETKLNPQSMTLYHNMLNLPFLCVGAAADGELGGASALFQQSRYVQTMVYSSAVLGFGVSFTGFYLNHAISATSSMVVQNVNKFSLILLNEVAVQHTHTWQSVLACGLVLTAAAYYSYARMTAAMEKKAEGTDARDKASSLLAQQTRALLRSSALKAPLAVLLVLLGGLFVVSVDYHNIPGHERLHTSAMSTEITDHARSRRSVYRPDIRDVPGKTLMTSEAKCCAPLPPAVSSAPDLIGIMETKDDGIEKLEDFFVSEYKGKPKYKECTKFTGTMPAALNTVGEEAKALPGILEGDD